MKDVKEMKTVELVAFYNEHSDSKPIKKFRDRATAEQRVLDLIEALEPTAEKYGEAMDAEHEESKVIEEKEVVIENNLEAEMEADRAAEDEELFEERQAELEVEEVDYEDLDDNDKELFDTLGEINCPHCGIHLSNGYHVHNTEVNGSLVPNKSNEYSCLGCGEEFGPALKKASSHLSEAIAKSWTVPETKRKRTQRSAVEVDGETYPSVRQAFIELDLPLKEHIKFRMALKKAKELEGYGYSWEIVPLNYED